MKTHSQKEVRCADLATAFLALKSHDEVMRFLKDVCTPFEIRALEERWKAAQLLHIGLTQRQAAAQTRTSLSTVTRVYRFLKEENNNGYLNTIKQLIEKGDIVVGEEAPKELSWEEDIKAKALALFEQGYDVLQIHRMLHISPLESARALSSVLGKGLQSRIQPQIEPKADL